VLKLQKSQSVLKPQMEMECDQISRNGRSLPMVQGNAIAASGQAAVEKESDDVMNAWVAAANDFDVDAWEVEASDFVIDYASGAPENEIPHDRQQIDGEAAEAAVGSPRAPLAFAMETVHEMQHGRVNSPHVA
jgi:hypothetical protein